MQILSIICQFRRLRIHSWRQRIIWLKIQLILILLFDFIPLRKQERFHRRHWATNYELICLTPQILGNPIAHFIYHLVEPSIRLIEYIRYRILSGSPFLEARHFQVQYRDLITKAVIFLLVALLFWEQLAVLNQCIQMLWLFFILLALPLDAMLVHGPWWALHHIYRKGFWFTIHLQLVRGIGVGLIEFVI